ncbi:MAG: DUF1553 domain-containing protein, partial [Bryobacteraceae bacterium]
RYIFTGEEPQSNNWRAELARILTSDKQFARATVNYLWAHFFTRGIVDPPDGWDPRRVDPNDPPPAPWPMQASHPQLLDALADEFVAGNFSLRRIMKLIAESNAYQLSSRYPGQWRSQYTLYFAKHFPRRLAAEEIYDAVVTATQTVTPMYVQGLAEPLFYATQLPDPTEPRSNGSIRTFLTNFGRGDWVLTPRKSTPGVLQVLFMMNDFSVNIRTFPMDTQNAGSRVSRIVQSSMTEDEGIRQLFLSTLSRYPAEAELATMRSLRSGRRDEFLSDIQWSLLNKLDFIFNY